MNKLLLIFVVIAIIVLAVLLTLGFQNAVSSTNENMNHLLGFLLF